MAKGVVKTFGDKVLYFTILDELIKNDCFLLTFTGGDCVYGIIRPVQFILVDRFFISLMVAELLSLNQEN